MAKRKTQPTPKADAAFIEGHQFDDGSSWMKFVGSREGLIERGLITERTRIPKRPRGCVNSVTSEAGEPDSHHFYYGKISMKRDGRLRVTLDGRIATRRDREFRTFMATVLRAETMLIIASARKKSRLLKRSSAS